MAVNSKSTKNTFSHIDVSWLQLCINIQPHKAMDNISNSRIKADCHLLFLVFIFFISQVDFMLIRLQRYENLEICRNKIRNDNLQEIYKEPYLSDNKALCKYMKKVVCVKYYGRIRQNLQLFLMFLKFSHTSFSLIMKPQKKIFLSNY